MSLGVVLDILKAARTVTWECGLYPKTLLPFDSSRFYYLLRSLPTVFLTPWFYI